MYTVAGGYIERFGAEATATFTIAGKLIARETLRALSTGPPGTREVR